MCNTSHFGPLHKMFIFPPLPANNIVPSLWITTSKGSRSFVDTPHYRSRSHQYFLTPKRKRVGFTLLSRARHAFPPGGGGGVPAFKMVDTF